ncbi:MAG: ATP-binding cassette domain-containing protein [Archangium sp.]|nr:ATP-binding cassette domain-containing protein [Archangium sp.]MDP3573069.1 ATP-binding cassette domain-containing protein [Archangium sp.]
MSAHTLNLRAQRLSFSYAERPLLDDVTFHLTPGWTGLVGANGSGKTTLLRLLLKELTPTSGHLKVEPEGARTRWCAQRVEEKDAEIDGFAWANDRLARQLHGRLRLRPELLERWPTLSPGERKRWQLGAVLWSEPEVLLLDEPSNHLDVEGLALLRGALAEFGGIGVIVSHDRALLDEVTTATLRLDGGGARLWQQPFSAARASWLAEEEGVLSSQRETKRRLQQEERRLDASRRTLEASERSRSAGARMRNRHDSDARGMGADFRAQMAERAHTRAAKRVERKVGLTREALEKIEVRDEAGQRLFLKYEPCPHQTVMQFEGPIVGRDVVLQVGRSEHVWISGPNGAGKTTLLRAVLTACKVPEEKRLVLPQELTREETLADLELLQALPKEERGRVLQLVHALGVEPEHLLRTEAPSPGEARKLRLALGLGRDCWLAVLDEPTNHLDLPAIERLEEALSVFPGALILVSHDARLGGAVTSREVRL